MSCFFLYKVVHFPCPRSLFVTLFSEVSGPIFKFLPLQLTTQGSSIWQGFIVGIYTSYMFEGYEEAQQLRIFVIRQQNSCRCIFCCHTSSIFLSQVYMLLATDEQGHLQENSDLCETDSHMGQNSLVCSLTINQ